MGFPGGSAGKEFAHSAGDLGLIPGLGRSPGEGNGYLLQFSGLENSMDYIVHGESDTTVLLSLSVFLPLFSLHPLAFQGSSLRLLCRTVSGGTLVLDFSISQLSSVAQSRPTLCDPMNHSTPGLPVHPGVYSNSCPLSR